MALFILMALFIQVTFVMALFILTYCLAKLRFPINNFWRDATMLFKVKIRVKYHKIQTKLKFGGHPQNFDWFMALFSSSEPKALGELLGWDSSRRPSVRPSVHTFRHEYLWDQPADHNQISSKALLGRGIGCIRFCARSDQNSGFHGNILLP